MGKVNKSCLQYPCRCLITKIVLFISPILFHTARRRTGSTCMNHDSSRSHSIFRIVIESREAQSTLNESENGLGSTGGAVRVASLNLVDLAGSERARQTGATGARLKEVCGK